jgi:hypothetical protein
MITETVKSCPSGKELNPNTKRCVNKCKLGFSRDANFKCSSIAKSPLKTRKVKLIIEKDDKIVNDIVETLDPISKHAELKRQIDAIKEEVEFNKMIFNPEIITTRNAKCIRKRSNFSFGADYNKIYNLVDLHPNVDNPDEGYDIDEVDKDMIDAYYGRMYNKTIHDNFLNLIKKTSPKLETLLNKIKELDKKDMATYGKHFKHFIFSDTKQGMAGVKLITSGLIASGFFLGYFAEPKLKKNKWGKLTIFDDSELQETEGENIFMLSSGGVYDSPISVINKKQILAKFNERPNNVYGKNVRFIVMDSGYKEGIDLFDIKYVHIFEPSITAADQKQVIGRGTRTCGQKGLEFHPTMGWPLHVFIYDLKFSEPVDKLFGNMGTGMELLLKALNLDVRLLNLTYELEKLCIEGSVDYELNKNIHTFSIGSDDSSQNGGAKKTLEEFRYDPTIVIQPRFSHKEMKDYIDSYYKQYSWGKIKMENQCGPSGQKGGASELIEYTPTQAFVSNFFTPQNPLKGMLLWHSVGTGKTCTAIATATASFERQGYTILWVTRTTLKNDIWKNMFNQICHEIIKLRVQNEGLIIPSEQTKRMKLLSPAWRVRPMSYKQFSNMVSKQNSIYTTMVKINGEQDPLRKTLLIIDEAHKLYGGGDLSTLEQPDMVALHNSLMNSYKVSGENSVKLLLMTATPIQFDPMELIKLIDLCKEEYQQIPSHFDEFSKEYLDDDGKFTKKGRTKFLDDIAGYISYLNREKDARQFSQPIIETILTDVISKENLALNNRATRKIVKEAKNVVTENITTKMKELEEFKKSIQPGKFDKLKKMCSGIKTKKILTKCNKLANSRIKDIVQGLKVQVTMVKENIKKLKDEAKSIQFVSNPFVDNKIEANSVFHMLAFKCTSQISSIKKAHEHLKLHPEIIPINREIEKLERIIEEEERAYNDTVDSQKAQINDMKKQLKVKGLEPDEIIRIKSTIEDTSKSNKIVLKTVRRMFKNNSRINRLDLKEVKRDHTRTIKELKKKIKSKMSASKKNMTVLKKEEKKLIKILKKSDMYEEEIDNVSVKDILSRHVDEFQNDIRDLDDDFIKETEAKEEAKQIKLMEKMTKKQDIATIKANAKLLKLQQQATAKTEKEAIKKAEQAEKAEQKLRKKEEAKAQREALKLSKKTTKKVKTGGKKHTRKQY